MKVLNFVVGLIVGLTCAWVADTHGHMWPVVWVSGFGVGFLLCFCLMCLFAGKVVDGLHRHSRPSRNRKKEYSDDYWWNDGKRPV